MKRPCALAAIIFLALQPLNLFTIIKLGGNLAFARAKDSYRRPSIIFCTSELEHLTAGGAGVVVADSARALVLAGWRVLIVIDIDDNGSAHEGLGA